MTTKTSFGEAGSGERLLKGTVREALQGGAANPLFSDDLTAAGRAVLATKDTALISAFENVAERALSADYARQGGSGFDLRQALGLAVNDILDRNDKSRFSRLLHDPSSAVSTDIRGHVELLLQTIEAHAKQRMMDTLLRGGRIEEALKINAQPSVLRDGYDPVVRQITFANGQRL